MRVFWLISVVLALCGCVTTELNAELRHVSHISQHFGAGTNYGYNAAALEVSCKLPYRFSLDLWGGWVLDACNYGYCGALYGPRDVAGAELKWRIW